MDLLSSYVLLLSENRIFSLEKFDLKFYISTDLCPLLNFF